MNALLLNVIPEACPGAAAPRGAAGQGIPLPLRTAPD